MSLLKSLGLASGLSRRSPGGGSPAPAAGASSSTTTSSVGAAAQWDESSVESDDMKIVARRSSDRGTANLGWLNTFHTFSFASYFDSRFPGFSSLRVLNEDRVKPGKGFGFHGHSNFEIFSYVVSGELTHRDSLGHLETLRRGDVQFTSAGRGIMHSEFNEHETDPVHFIQIWVSPSKRGLEPRYETRSFKDEDKFGKLVPIVSSRSDLGAIAINQDVTVFASILGGDSGADSVEYKVSPGRSLYVHLIQDAVGFDLEAGKTALDVNGLILRGGDGAFITQRSSSGDLEAGTGDADAFEDAQFKTVKFTAHSDARAEFLVFDLSAST